MNLENSFTLETWLYDVERTDLLALVCDVQLWRCHFPIGIMGQVWCLIVSIPELCPPSNFAVKCENAPLWSAKVINISEN